MKDYTFKVKRSKKNSTVNVNMAGQLNVSNMSEIKDELEKTAKGYKTIAIKIEDVEDTDLTLLQMLKAFQISCVNSKVEVAIELDLNNDYKSLFERAGLLNILN